MLVQSCGESDFDVHLAHHAGGHVLDDDLKLRGADDVLFRVDLHAVAAEFAGRFHLFQCLSGSGFEECHHRAVELTRFGIHLER